jgi:dTDP-L-rhamnose 4-epimerase
VRCRLGARRACSRTAPNGATSSHVADVARANVLALTCDEPGAFNVATGRPRTVLDMARALARDGPAPVVTGAYRAGDVRHVFAAADRATQRLGFRATVGLEQGMAEFARAPLRA